MKRSAEKSITILLPAGPVVYTPGGNCLSFTHTGRSVSIVVDANVTEAFNNVPYKVTYELKDMTPAEVSEAQKTET